MQLETCEEQLDPPIVSNKNPWEALGHPPGRGGASALPTRTGRDSVGGLGRHRSGSGDHGGLLGLLRPSPGQAWGAITDRDTLPDLVES